MTSDLTHWTPRPLPPHTAMEGRYVRLEPLDADRHAGALYVASNVPDKEDKFRWLFEAPPTDEARFTAWVAEQAAKRDPLFYAIIDLESGKVAGRQALMRMDTNNGSIEIGSIYWGPLLSRRRGATEACYLFMKQAFDELGYRRFEWKCNDQNLPSKRAAERFGFRYEGLFRQHMVIKGENRDTAWFSIIDTEWPALKAGYESWLDEANFDANGQQVSSLQDCLAKARQDLAQQGI
ncbi:GNAT family N-acetyltransferase [Cohaesibacter intestini]|uniref:GNAT family N-acetyltransferase n=1 Tax=Cohaesibacter intestini TaxID=2211145 RepID=UPI000DE8B837|nr:GNAT family protein [Cohaesibacter intestini]